MRTRTFRVGMGGASGAILEPNHQVMNGLFNSVDFDSDKVGDGYLSVFGLANIECP